PPPPPPVPPPITTTTMVACCRKALPKYRPVKTVPASVPFPVSNRPKSISNSGILTSTKVPPPTRQVVRPKISPLSSLGRTCVACDNHSEHSTNSRDEMPPDLGANRRVYL